MQQHPKWLPVLQVVAGTVIVVVALVEKLPSDTWLYLGFATLALVPLAHVVVANMHAETLMRELARIKAHDLEDLDKRIEKLHELVKQLKKPEERSPRKNPGDARSLTKPEEPSPPQVQRSSSLADILGKAVELVSQAVIAASPSNGEKLPAVQLPSDQDK